MNFEQVLYTRAKKQIIFWIIATICTTSLSIFVGSYFFVVQRIDTYQDRIRRDFGSIENGAMRTGIPPQLVDVQRELRAEVFTNLVILQGAVLVTGAVLSPLIAKQLLSPIRKTHEQQAAFAMNANHQIRTPLTVMLSEIEAIRMDNSPSIKSYKKSIDSIEEESVRLLAITRELLLSASKNNNDLSVRATTVKQLEMLSKKLGAVHKVEVLPSVDSHIETLPIGEDTLFMILDILIDNTSKHAVAKEKKAIISLKNVKKGIEFTYGDNGARQGKNQPTQAQPAVRAGQGLNILRALLERNGAELTLANAGGYSAKINFSVKP